MVDSTNGLLDFVQTPMGVGLLSAAFGGLAGAGRGGPINTLGTAGLSGIAGYSAASANGLKRQKADLLQRQMQTLPTLYGQDPEGNATFDWKSAAALGLGPEDIAKYAQLPNSTKSKVARTVEVPGADGGKQTMQYDEYGRPVGQAIDSYVPPQQIDLGNEKRFVIPTAGQVFNVGMTPGDKAADDRGWAGIANQRELNGIQREGIEVQREAQRNELVTGPDGNTYRVDRGTGQATPVVTQQGTPFRDSTKSNLTESEGKNTLYLSQMRDALNTFDKVGVSVSPARVALTNSPYTNAFAGPAAQQVAQAQRQWAEGFLRAKTGAAAQPGEVDNNIRTFFPVVGDSDAVIKQKALARAQATRDMEVPAGRGAEKATPRNALQPQPQLPAPLPQAGAFTDPDKEARYQEFKRRQGQ